MDFKIISTGVSTPFVLLHARHEGTTLPGVVVPPRANGTIWSMVNALNVNFSSQ